MGLTVDGGRLTVIRGRSTDNESQQLAPILAIAAEVHKLARLSAEDQLAAAAFASSRLLVDDEAEGELARRGTVWRIRNPDAKRVAFVGHAPSGAKRARRLPALDRARADASLLSSSHLGNEDPGRAAGGIGDVELDTVAVDVGRFVVEHIDRI